ncbi:CheR family methyltransferase [Thalassococcus sp. BH17M4-6]|uniref:CheR family methyltransferase n=1 Tax=Thalassococcus sp. BH17M4-6 TaxID=3413148 RepID=UPI003BE7F9F2
MTRDTKIRGVVGIGASAGGLEALNEMVAAIPERSGLAFVIVQHLSPDHPSIMDELLASHTALPVRKIKDGMQIAPDCIFVIPAGPSLEIADDRFRLVPRDTRKGVRTPIDNFLTSLSQAYGETASCVILSGTGTDGTLGLKAIKTGGGIALVQESASARFPGMPDSAAATGVVDARLPPGDVPANLISLLNHRDDLRNGHREDRAFASIESRLGDVLDLLNTQDGQDFSSYKPGTLVRRIERRMMLQLQPDIDGYLSRLRREPDERTRLLQDFLIGVTRFFRDPDSFAALTDEVIAPLLARDQDSFRIWVPGCATGEEAYSIGILFSEALRKADDRRELQIFGTDIDLNSLRHARSAMYSDATLEKMPEELIERYFTAHQGHYQISTRLREKVAFAPHNLLRDPPFSRIDFISCRNLLIYLNADGQNAVMPRFHYALRRSGFLFLGPSESVDGRGNFFTPVSRDHRIYRRNDAVTVGFSALTGRRPPQSLMPQRHIDTTDTSQFEAPPIMPDYESQIDQFFLTRHSPPYFVVNSADEVSYLSGTLGPYIRPAKGVLSARLEDLLSLEIRSVVRPLLAQVRDDGGSAADVVSLTLEGAAPTVRVTAEALPFSQGDTMIVIQPVERADVDAGRGASATSDTVQAAEDELAKVRRRLNVSEAGHAVAEQELRSANEELLSMNEELQSSNEELETSREELQSINEELETINAELTENNTQLNEVNSDLKNVLDSTDIAKLILAPGLIVRRFTRTAQTILHIDDRDIGRRVTDLKWQLDYPELVEDVARVEETLQVVDREIPKPATGECFQVRVRPYRRIDDRLDGCIITFFDITRRKQAELDLRESQERLTAALEAGKLGVHVFYPQSGKIVWDDRMREIWSVAEGREVDYDLFMDRLHPDDRAATQAAVDAALDPDGDGKYVAEYRVMQPDGSPLWVRADGTVTIEDGKAVRLVGTVKDITERHRAEQRMQEYAARLELTYEVTGIAAWEWQVSGDESRWTPNMFDLLGAPLDAKPSLATFASYVVPEDRDRVLQELDSAMESGKLFDSQFRIRRGDGDGDGDERVFVGKGRIIYNRSGEPTSMIGINYDVTSDVEKEERRTLLTSELNHRVKNSLATIQAIASQTVRHAPDMDSFKQSFMGRLRAISRAHDLLVNLESRDGTVAELVASQVGPYASQADRQLQVTGPRIQVGPSVAHGLGLVLHELATNASKYGALSVEGGRVEIDWTERQIDGEPGLRLDWREIGGPPVDPPDQTGFGTVLIADSLSHSLGGRSRIDYARDGLVAEIECKLRGGED